MLISFGAESWLEAGVEGLHTATEALCVPRPSVCVLHTTSDAQFAISRTTFCTFVHILHILCNVLQNTEPSTMSGNFVFFLLLIHCLPPPAKGWMDFLFVCLFSSRICSPSIAQQPHRLKSFCTFLFVLFFILYTTNTPHDQEI